MKITRYLYNPHFRKLIKAFPLKEKARIIRKVNLFLADPYSPNLKTHKLSGRLKNYGSFSVSYNLRVLFRFYKENVVEFVDLGTHEIYK